MHMISHDAFARLRLKQFLPPDAIAPLTDWEFLGRFWIGEGHGFTQWLRLEDDPSVLRSLAVDFHALPDVVVDAILTRLDLPVRRGMTIDQLRRVLGEPREVQTFVTDRLSYDFDYGEPDEYDVSCTVLNDGGLTYLVVTVPLEESDV